MLLDKSDVSQMEIARIMEAMGLITNMCLQMSISLSCKSPNKHALEINIVIKSLKIINFLLSHTWSRNKMGRNLLLFFTLCSK